MADVFLHSADGQLQVPITVGRARLQRLAKHWHYVLRSRRRWIKDSKLSETIETRARDHLNAIGVNQEQLAELGRSGLVEVSVESTAEVSADKGWEQRLMPWEYVLSAATRPYRGENIFLVVRRLTTPARSHLRSDNNTGLFIQSAPGRLHGRYVFDTEYKVLDRYVGESVTMMRLDDPTIEGIRDQVCNTRPAVIHMSGIDSFQGSRLLDPDQNTPASAIKDGLFLRDENWNEKMVDSFSLAEAITAGDKKPLLVSFNVYNSSARTAAFVVARGAGAAVGFQDSVEDILAEIFFANFYLHWSGAHGKPVVAFKRTMESLEPYRDRLRGTGLVLWSSEPLTPVPPAYFEKSDLPLDCDETAGTPLRDWVTTHVQPHAKLNYSVLHNGRRPLFDEFSIYRLEPRHLRDLEVEVELQIGSERFPYKRMISMRDHVVDLADQIGVGLTSRLARSLQEAVRTTLFVHIGRQADRLRSETMHVSLLPISEWRDDDASRVWLPSFVLPRDPAVLKIIVAAQRYLMALSDNANAGFDGYQSVDTVSQDPTENIDSQVRAIWCALLHDFRLNYINPPPTFTSESQRLRTPSDVIDGQRGTCMDLALTIAACLEYIGLNPVIFLLNGHAFPGYWSSDAERDSVLVTEPPLMETESSPTPLPDEKEEEEEIGTYVQRYPWEFDRSRYEEIMTCIEQGVIVPLESTLLTNRGGFWEAIEEGIRDMEDPEQFHSMLDIKLARDSDVTPLPLTNEGG